MAVRISCMALLIGLALTGDAVAEVPEESNGRFTMSPVDGGFLRLDKQTGAVAMCARSAGDWACKPVEDRAAPAPATGAISRLEDENRALKDRVKSLEEALETGKPPVGGQGPIGAGPPGGKVDLPTEQEVDQALDYMERVYKKIRDRIKNLDQPLPPGPGGPGKGAL